ncbi:hypothetical protein DFJ58DRAFT_278661 [Suillus subalutaceus]|uniref:uncharacterized protein n=1 Tax=Suillus subalutaceus TaxID=48586 RepID=UPI001B86A27F|nr:uncharacterized protein DFJ58DRAFT_278661 [Suillus subalutaceus]KAG1860132.1 hypothetical protein DFJ58DRAFT_278661 [Suillus subalutaceus]
MQLPVLLSALVSFVILAAASPTPGAISKLSSKRENLDISFQRDLLGKSMERELATGLNDYSDYDQVDRKRDFEDYCSSDYNDVDKKR